MKRIVTLVFAVIVVIHHAMGGTCRAQEVVTEAGPQDRVELELRVQRLVQMLEAGERQRRDEAEQELIELGESVLSLLPEITAETSAETKERLTRIRGTLDQVALSAAMEPSRVTLEGEFTLAEIVDKFQQQTGNRLIDFRDRFGQQAGEIKLSVEYQNMAFWPALDQLLDQARLTTYGYTGEPRSLGIVAANENQMARFGSASYPGIFRIEATEIQAQRNLRSPDNAALRIRLEVLWEPRVTPVLIRQPYRDVHLTADDGSSVALASPDGVATAPIQNTVAGIDLVLPLQLPDRTVTKLASFKARMYAQVPGREETFEFDNLADARGVAQRRGGLEVTLERVRKNGAVFEFRIQLRLLNNDDRFQSHLDWASNNTVYLVNSKGETIDNPNFERYLEREREVGFGYLFPVQGDLSEYRLVYKSPAAILTVPIDYELKDIPLP